MDNLLSTWWARGVAAGLAGTTAMTSTYGIERRLRHSHGGPLDYDDSTTPAQAAMVVLRIKTLDDRHQRELGYLVHWGYGSAMGIPRELLGRYLSPRRATVVYGVGLLVMTGTLFPVLGGTPPPWRWKPDVILTSVLQHAVYAVVVGAAVDAGRRAAPAPGALDAPGAPGAAAPPAPGDRD